VDFDQNIALTLAVVRSFFITASRNGSRTTARNVVNGNTNNVRTATELSGTRFTGKKSTSTVVTARAGCPKTVPTAVVVLSTTSSGRISRITARSAVSGSKSHAHTATEALSDIRPGGKIHLRCAKDVGVIKTR